MYSSDIDVITKMAEKKARNANEKTGKYIGRAVVTGFYILVAIILSYTTGAILYPKYPEVSKVIVAATFCFAIALIVISLLFKSCSILMFLEVLISNPLYPLPIFLSLLASANWDLSIKNTEKSFPINLAFGKISKNSSLLKPVIQ